MCECIKRMHLFILKGAAEDMFLVDEAVQAKFDQLP